MTEILEIKVFFTGLAVGISLYQGKVVSAHEKKRASKDRREIILSSGWQGTITGGN